jgi:acyl-CoA thioester hydrolase
MTALARSAAGPEREEAHRFALRVYYEDTDAAGIVYYANYLKFAERARTEMLRQLGFEQEALRRTTGRVFAVRHCSADYLAPARLDDALLVATRLTALGGASLTVVQEIACGDRILVRLALRLACLDADGRPARLPSALRAALARFLAHPAAQSAAPHSAAPDSATDGQTTRMIDRHAR